MHTGHAASTIDHNLVFVAEKIVRPVSAHSVTNQFSIGERCRLLIQRLVILLQGCWGYKSSGLR